MRDDPTMPDGEAVEGFAPSALFLSSAAAAPEIASAAVGVVRGGAAGETALFFAEGGEEQEQPSQGEGPSLEAEASAESAPEPTPPAEKNKGGFLGRKKR